MADLDRREFLKIVGMTAGGYARNLDDTVRIHVNTTRELHSWPEHRDGEPT